MKGLLKQIKYRFYRQNITKRIIIVITMLSILSNTVFVGSVFIIMKNQLFYKTRLDHEKDITMLQKELEMFFNGIRNDAVSVLVSDSCQTLLSDSEEFLSKDTAIQYRKYQLMQGMIMSTIGQRPEYNTIAFYDLNGNCYADERLIASLENLESQQGRVRDFLALGGNETVTNLHKSPWRKKKDAEFKDCISYLRKVYNKNQGQLIGVVELEIPNDAIKELYEPIMENGSSIYLISGDSILSAGEPDMLYQSLAAENWYVRLNRVQPVDGLQIVKTRKNIFFQKQYGEFDWKIIDVVPTYTYMRDVQLYAFIDIMIGILLLFGNLYISRILIASITKPLSKITNTIVDI